MLWDIPPTADHFLGQPMDTQTDNGLRLMMYMAQEPVQENKLQGLTSSLYTKEKERSLADAGYSDVSSCDPTPEQTIVTVQPSTKVL